MKHLIKRFSLIVVFLTIPLMFFSQIQKEVRSSRGYGLDLALPGAFLLTEDDKFSSAVSGLSNNAIIELGLNEDMHVYHPNYFKIKATFDVQLVSISSVTTTLTGQQLIIDYDPAELSKYKDKAQLIFPNYYKVKIYNVVFQVCDINLANCNNNIFNDIYIDAQVSTERIYNFSFGISGLPTSEVGSSYDAINNELNVFWNFYLGATEYELEYTYVDDYDYTGGVAGIRAQNLINYDFKHDATRIITPFNNFKIPLNYERGYIVYRVRPIGRASNGDRLEGIWNTIPETGTIGSLASTYVPNSTCFVSTSAFQSDLFNWVSNKTFAEQGKAGTGLSFIDATGLNRQSIARLNFENKSIVQSTLFDHYSRPTYNMLPSPISGLNFSYRTNLNKYFNGSSVVNFDNNIFDKCVGPCVIPNYVLDTANSTGATKYYSPSNINQKSQQGFIPDAEGLAYTAVKYKADGSGRIIRQSSPGFTHKLGGGKDIQYFYSNPSQVEIDRLFGKEAGTQNKYTKNFVIDANGQTSTSYIDMYGRTVATALLGDEPPGLLPLPNKTSAVTLTDNMAVLPTNSIDTVKHCIEVNTSFFVPGTNDQQVFNYATTLGTFLPAECTGNLCFDCVYSLEISIKSECDEEVFYDHDSNPLTPAIPLVAKIGGNENNLAYNCGIAGALPNGSTIPQLPGYQIPNAPITIVFPKPGVYNIKKSLCVSSDPIPSYLDQFLNNGSCTKNYCTIVDSVIAQTSINSCALPSCQQCLESITTYTNSHPNGTEGALTSQQIDNMVGNCNLLCPKTACDKLKLQLMLDFVPNSGFFGTTNQSDPNWIYSVYNTTATALGANSFSSNNDYVSPPMPYLNNQNLPATVLINSISYAPQALTLSNFVSNFQLSWAASFLPLHPEYCKLKFQCEVIGAATNYDDAMLSENHYELACASGHLRPNSFSYSFGPNTTACAQLTDPVFSLGSPYTTLVSNLSNSLTTDYNNTGTNLYYQSANTVRGSSNMSGYVFGTDVCTADKEWLKFRDDYTSLKQTFYYNAFNIYTSTYVTNGVGECVLNPANFPTGYTTVFDDDSDFIDYGIDPATLTPSAIAAYQTSQCSTACNAYVPLWKSNLQNGCSAYNSLTTLQQNAVLTAMEAICNLGCDANHPMGSSSTANSSIGYTIPSTSSVVHNFQEVLNYYGLTSCGSYLFSQPLPYAQSSYTAMTKLTDCKCDQLLQIDYGFSAASTATPSINTKWKYFKHVYGFDMGEFDALLCKCKSIIAPSTWAPGYAWTPTQLTNLYNSTETVNPKLTCKSCINCEDATTFLNSIYSTFPNHAYANAVAAIQNDPMNEQFAENALNQHYGVNYTMQEYTDLLNDCASFNASNIITHNISPQIHNLFNYLSDLLGNHMLTVPHPMKVCTDQQYFLTTLFNGVLASPLPSTYSYAVPVPGNNMQITINNSAALPSNLCTINLSLPVGFVGGWPAIASFQSVQGYYPSPIAGPQYNFQILALDINSNPVTINCSSCYSVTTLMGSQPKPVFCGNYTPPNPNQCQITQINNALNLAQSIYNDYLTSFGAQFTLNYKNKCLAAAQEQFTRIYDLGEYNYTLYYYDQSGNLQRTVPPKGVIPLGITTNLTTNTYPNHSLINAVNNNYVNDYRFNSLDEVLAENTVDGGKTIYFYDQAGRILASQNAKQKAMSGNVYSYTLYDVYGRIYEIGQVNLASAVAASNVLPITYNSTFISSINAGTKSEIIITTYDNPTGNTAVLTAFGGAQNNLRNRVSYVTYYANVSSVDHASFYSYDQHGNVQKIVQLNYKLQTDFPSTNAGLKVIEYEYELISGNMIKATYQKGTIENFMHRYWYDTDNRLKEVFTSKDNINWDRDAKYIYYEHGPLARIERADKQVQGSDYFYTIHGWIKGVNSNALTINADVGKDGTATNLYNSNYSKMHNYFAADAMGYGLNYYNAGSNVDYKAISALKYNSTTYLNPVANTAALTASQFNLNVDGPSLYNGNISSMVTAFIDKNSGNLQANNVPNPQITAYKYDQLHRIKQMKAFHNLSLNSWHPPTVANDDDSYNMTFSYDENGNILTLTRNGAGAKILSTPQLAMDDLNYKYFTTVNGFGKNTNQLACLTDQVSASALADDIDAPANYAACLIAADGVNAPYQSASSTRFKYDEVGNLIADAGEYIQTIEWTADRKVKKVTRNATAMLATGTGPTSVYKADIEYEYNTTRQRVVKIVKPRDMATKALKPANEWLYTYYVYDASGNVLATYDRSTNLVGATYQEKLKLAENHIYGSERLAIAKPTNTLVQWQYNYPNCGSDPPIACRISPPGVITGLPAPPSTTYTAGRIVGYKEFELTNHLGNIITTVSDRKLQATYDAGSCISYYDLNSGVPSAFLAQNMTLASSSGQVQATIQNGMGISGLDVRFGYNLQPGVTYKIEYDFDPGTGPNAVTLSDGLYILPYDYNGSSFYLGPYYCNGSFVPGAGHYSFLYTPTAVGPAVATYLAFNSNSSSTHNFKLDNVSLCPVNAPPVVSSYTADLLMHTDYYPFGQEMPGRKWAASNYRYGMNGQEKDDEIASGLYSAEYWEYDSRIGRRWNIDPVIKSWESPYACFNDNPIYYVDPSGLDGEGPNGECPGDKKVLTAPDGHKSTYKYVDNTVGWQGQGMETQLGEVTVKSMPDFVESPNSVDDDIAIHGIEHYAPQKVNVPDGSMQWEKDFAQYNFEVETKRWNNLSYEEKWREAYKNIMMDQLSDFAKKAAEPVAELYTLEAELGGSGMASGTRVVLSKVTAEIVETEVKVVETTLHGAERIEGAAATRGGVLSLEGVNTTKNLGTSFAQADGAIVYLHEVSPGRYNAVVEGSKGIITTMKGWSKKSIDRIAKNYGWNIK